MIIFHCTYLHIHCIRHMRTGWDASCSRAFFHKPLCHDIGNLLAMHEAQHITTADMDLFLARRHSCSGFPFLGAGFLVGVRVAVLVRPFGCIIT